ncbi:MAG: MFS transporter [Planctomycetes bacterium]|nr:MFS transporter [Planctomycetota bacterium]NOG54929.1 MFS transporter [Planctomycetota bacterium]
MNHKRLFIGSCFSLISTSVAFAVIGDVMGPLKDQFVLSNEQIGYVGGAALWGFTISIFVLGPLVDALGMRNLMRFAMICHVAGPLIMIFSRGEAAFYMLFGGALVLAMGNGTVEAVCNPLVATLYPDQKTRKLNQFHVWFPGGIVIGSLLCYGMGQVSELMSNPAINDWRIKLGLIIVPTVVYAFLFAGQKFPATERVQSGVSFEQMIKAAVRPLFIVLLLCMCITASLELGPNRWVIAVLGAGGIAGALVLAYINFIMAVLRFFAGPVVHRLSPTGILVTSAILAGIGLCWLSFSQTTAMAFASATVFAVGVCYFWPTMLGVVSERVPRSGALGLALTGGIGMLAVGLVTSPQMGHVADKYLLEKLDSTATNAVLTKVIEVYPQAAADKPDIVKEEAQAAVTAAQTALSDPTIDAQDTTALRSAISNNPGGDADAVVDEVNAILNPADNYGGRISFRFVAPFSILIMIVFGILYVRDRAAGGYAVESIHEEDQAPPES